MVRQGNRVAIDSRLLCSSELSFVVYFGDRVAGEIFMAKRSVLCVAIVLGMATAGPAWAADSAKSEAMFGAGRRALDKGHFSAALVQLKKAAETDTEIAAVRLKLGTAQLTIGDVASAEKELKRATATRSPSPRSTKQSSGSRRLPRRLGSDHLT